MTGVSDNTERQRRRATMCMSVTDPAADGTPGRSVVLVGGSVRALAESAARSGWHVHAADLFGDVDLRRTADEVVRVAGTGAAGYPAGLPAAVRGFPAAPLIYTGGLENHPTIIAALARERPLAGSAPAAVRIVRDPVPLAAVVRRAGLAYPETVSAPDDVPTDGSFLIKPVASAGGRGVRRWRGTRRSPATDTSRWQRFVPGAAWSVSFLAAPRGCELFAASRQLVGCRWCGGRAFAYCGSLDVPLDEFRDPLRVRLESLGRSLAADCGLIGAFGVDLVIGAGDDAHVIEVNPRPTASMELVERATGRPIAAAHLVACGYAAPPMVFGPAAGGVWSKAIVYAARTGGRRAPPLAALDAIASAWGAADGIEAVADIPDPSQPLPAGGPLVTVFARGATANGSLVTLRRRVAEVRRLFAADPISPPSAAGPARPPWPRGSTA